MMSVALTGRLFTLEDAATQPVSTGDVILYPLDDADEGGSGMPGRYVAMLSVNHGLFLFEGWEDLFPGSLTRYPNVVRRLETSERLKQAMAKLKGFDMVRAAHGWAMAKPRNAREALETTP